MNKISGKVVLEENGAGIPNLRVEICDIDPTTLPKKDVNRYDVKATTKAFQGIRGDRIGSKLWTELNGTFEFSYDLNGETQKYPNLFLIVTAPENSNNLSDLQILYVSDKIQPSVGGTEVLIKLTAQQLQDAGVGLPSSPGQQPLAPDELIDNLQKDQVMKEEIDNGIRAINAIRIEKVRARSMQFNEKIKPHLIKALSRVPDELASSDTFLKAGESVAEKTNLVIKRGIESETNVTNLSGHIGLTQEQKQMLIEKGYQDDHGNFVDVPAEVIEPILFGKESGNGHSTILLRDDPIAKLCREKTPGEKCLDEDVQIDDDSNVDGDSEKTENEDVTGDNVEAVTSEDMPTYIASLIDSMTAPEEPVVFGVTKPGERADQSTVENNVNTFLLKSGPAETKAFHDFSILNIAFEHVWQEAIDEGVLKLAEDAYKDIVELGGDPCADPFNVIPGAVVDFVDCFQRETDNAERAFCEDPPFEVVKAFGVTRAQWTVLNLELHEELKSLSRKLINLDDSPGGIWTGIKRSLIKLQGERILSYADSLLETECGPFNHLHQVLKELSQRMKEDYPFTIYGANRQEHSINFGVMVTYRQEWQPLNYQVGELIKSIPLAPKEVRKFSKKTVIQRKRFEKEIENSLRSRKEEASETSRSEEEIIRKALAKTNFNLSADSTFNIGITKNTVTTKLGKDASKDSSEVKKEFREAVFKSAQEYKRERRIEVTTEESFEEEFVESGEIMNPNEELTCTFLFYELQRRYRVSEQIHRLTAVILVAQEVPKPHEIDEDWLIAHDWILKRVLLDDSHLPALNYLSTRVVGDEFALEEMRKNVEQQRKIVEAIKEELVAIRTQVGRRYAALERAIEERAGIVGGEEGLLEDATRIGTAIVTHGLSEVGRFLGLGGDGDEDEREAARIRQDAAREAFERAARREKEFLSRLQGEATTLNAITESYTKAMSEHLNRKTEIARLRVHIKQNILHYMQAIWLHEPPDQRFFRLHKVKVPDFGGTRRYTVDDSPQKVAPLHTVAKPAVTSYSFAVRTTIDSSYDTVDLEEVADLDNLLGFKGNYMIFPLQKANALTDFMMAPYVDEAFELHDPDEFGNITLDDFSKYVCCLKQELTDEQFEERRPELKEQLKNLLTSPHRNNEELIVPTDSLYIEALPGAHPILEDFKLMHRAIDVKKVQAEVREMELENVRAAARLLSAKDDRTLLDDPDIESVKRVIVSGNGVQRSIDVGDES